MVQTLCTSGKHEALKCGVHATAGVVAAVMAAYNIAACCFRRDRHLRVNAVVYTLAIAWEIKQTLHHLDNTAAAPARDAAPPIAQCA
jgi:glycerol uptake facilitator-like aquaporin